MKTLSDVTRILVLCVTIPSIGYAQFPDYPEPFLPQLSDCMNTTPKKLPVRWEATTLMAPYRYTGEPYNFFELPERASLVVGKFVYNARQRLMRATQYGVTDEGKNPVDLLITDGATYVLHDDGYGRPQCIGEWHKTYEVPSRVLQSAELEATCVGSHPIAPSMDSGPDVDWWKQRSPITSPGAAGLAADWYWTNAKGHLVRTMFWGHHDGLPAILGDYAYTNFYEFKRGNRTNLRKIYKKCVGKELPVMNREQLLAHQTKKPVHHPNRISDLIPGLSFEACQDYSIRPPSWPVEMYATSFSTAAKYDTPKPLPTSVHYQPQVPRIRTRLHKEVFSDALLVGNASYGVDTDMDTLEELGCGQGPNTSLPGSPYPYWGNQGGCQCFGVIEDNRVLSHNRRTQLIGCPLPLVATNLHEQQGNTMFWMWYTDEDPPEPIVFLQTEPDVTIGTGLSHAEYAYWNPQPVADEVFTLPEGPCAIPPADAPTPPPACLKCHITSTNTEE